MTNKNKRTGSRNELELSKLLSKELNMEFQRQPLSGSLKDFPGDIYCKDERWEYSVEVKSVRSFSWDNLYDGTHAQMDKWLTQSHAQSENPLLIFKVSRRGWYMCQPLVGWSILAHEADCMVYTVYNQHIIMTLDEWINTYKRCIE